ncbi:MAG TPA: Smr/MutS family protein [Magnetospirillaceae bacterium]|nr:Smr/MutS family protein [Magnetospirillaceae bacterium]
MADFGKILEEWDRSYPQDGSASRRDMEVVEPGWRTRTEIEALPVEAVLDLHGHTAASAEAALDRFFRDAASQGVVKVLVIHGKGHHSAGKPVLKLTVQRFLHSSPLAGRCGQADRKSGGGGAVWVLVRPGLSALGK